MWERAKVIRWSWHYALKLYSYHKITMSSLSNFNRFFRPGGARGKRFSQAIYHLASPLLILLFISYLARHYHAHYTSPFIKVSIFLILLALVSLLSKNGKGVMPNRRTLWAEYVLLLFLLFPVFDHALTEYGPRFSRGPTVDYGYITVKAAKLFFISHLNPYSEVVRQNKNPAFRGYERGPLTFIVYGASAYYPPVSYKITTLVLLLLVMIAIGILTRRPHAPPPFNLSTLLFAFILLIAHDISLKILFVNGAMDLVPTLLVLLSFIFIRYQKWLPAGVSAGLAFAAKFAPPILLILLLIRRDFKTRFFIGAAFGLLPLLAFLIWDPLSFINNNFLFHFSKPGNSTSLYSITPSDLHYLFPVIQAAAVLYFWLINLLQPVKLSRLIRHFVILLLLLNASYTQIHANHLVVLLPFIAVIMSSYRYNLLPNLCGFSKNKRGRKTRGSVKPNCVWHN